MEINFTKKELIYVLEPDSEELDNIVPFLASFMRAFKDFKVRVVGQTTKYGIWAPLFKDLRSVHSKFCQAKYASDYVVNPTSQFSWEVDQDNSK